MPNTAFESNVGQYAVSAQGDVVVARGGFYPQRRMVLVRRAPSGALRPLALPAAQYQFVRSSPTGDRLAISMRDDALGFGTKVILFDLARELLTPVKIGRASCRERV